jgi:autotransporter-associated beta strand protein
MKPLFQNICPAILMAGILLSICIIPVSGQRQMEELDRGLLAVKVSKGVFVSWRVLGTEWQGVSYNLYRGIEKLNPEPISGASNFLDTDGALESTYHVCAIIKGIEQEASESVVPWSQNFYDIPLREIPGTYELNEASVGDLDGDGDYEIVLKRPSTDMSEEPAYTHLLEAYHLDGTHMWTIDYGPNHLAPKQNNFIVYDLDGDGKAEVVTKTSDGGIDGTGTEMGDTDGDGIINYRFSTTENDITQGPEYLSVYDGLTGQEVDRIDYIARDPLVQWGLPGMSLTQLAHRADAVMMAVIYANGKTPTLVMCRGIYHRTKMVALNYKNEKLTELWSFDSKNYPENYDGQGNHNLSVADVDQDGRDEIIYGSMTVDHDGTGLYGTGLGHGDAMHVSDMDPERPGLEVWVAQEEGPHYGGTYRDARTGEILNQYFGTRDMGRGCAGDISADYPGYEMWGGTECPIYSSNGSVIGPDKLIPANFMIWWDGDLLREFLDHNWLGTAAGVGVGTISKYNGSDDVNILTANGTYSINGTKGNPTLSADIFGDWREEVIWRTTDNKKLRIYTSTYPTTHRIPTLMHDPQYRLAIAWQMNAYNQPPHPGFYLGSGMDSIPPPPLTGENLVWNKGGTWDQGSSPSWIKEGSASVFQNGDPVLFDILGGESDTVSISGKLEPSSLSVYAPTDYSFMGDGSIEGPAGLLKSGSGSLKIHNHNNFSGYSSVWCGSLLVHGSVMSPVNIKRFASAGGSGRYGKGITFEALSTLIPGESGSADTLFIEGKLKVMDRVTWSFDLSGDSTGLSSKNDMVMINGDLVIEGTQTISINIPDDSLQTGSYTLISYSGDFQGKLDSISVTGISGIPWEIYDTGQAINIRFLKTRNPATLVWKGGIPNDWDLVKNLNWTREGESDWFVPYDTVLFTDEGTEHNSVTLVGDLYAGLVKLDAQGDYLFSGSGSISGTCGILKKGAGTLRIENTNDYTGPSLIYDGTIEIAGLMTSGEAGPLGAGSGSAENLVLDGGTLRITSSSSSDRNMRMGPGNGTLEITGEEFRMHGSLSGEGQVIKTGSGTLVWQIPNSHKGGTLLKEGRIHLGTEEANQHGPGPGTLILENATLSMIDNKNSSTDDCDWNLFVPGGYVGWIDLDSRCTLTGRLEGSGTLNLNIPFIRSYLSGDWSAFEGRINTTAKTSGGNFLVGGSSGFGKAHIHLGDYVSAIHSQTSDLCIEIGALTGTSLSRLGAGGERANTLTWKVGGRNTDSEFKGIICNDQFKNTGASAAIIKTGSGDWTLTNNNTYSGGTTVEAGKLWVKNTEGSGTGTGAVHVLGGATLGGTGTIAGEVTVESGAVVLAGPEAESVLTIDTGLCMKAGSYYAIDVNPINKRNNLLRVNGDFTMEGYVYFTNFGEVSFAAGDVYHLAEAGTISGVLGGILPVSPGEGLVWDTTEWFSKGNIRVELASGISARKRSIAVELFPNPADNSITIRLQEEEHIIKAVIENISGQKVRTAQFRNSNEFSMDLEGLPPGYYLLELDTGSEPFVQRFIKN